MKFPDLTDLAFRNLRQAVLRNTLTTVGIGVGVASLVAMLSLGIGLQELANRQFRKSGLFDTVFVSSRSDQRNAERERRRGQAPDAAAARALNEQARNEIAKVPNVAEVYPAVRFYSDVRYGDQGHPTTVSALPQSARLREAFDVLKGNYFSTGTAPEAILLKEYAKELAGDADPTSLIGKELSLQYFQHGVPVSGGGGGHEGTAPQGFQLVRKNIPVKVVGEIETDPYGGFGMGGTRIWIPTQFAESLHVAQAADMRNFNATPGSDYALLFVRVNSPKNVSAVEEQIKKSGFEAESLLDASKSLQRFFAVLDGFLGIFGSLALAVATLGIVNTLVMSILERRREIGIMKAIGASDGDIQKLFFTEAASMGALGGALGVALGWIIGRAINFGLDAYLRRNQIPEQQVWMLPPWLVLVAVAFSIVVSLAAGLYPARRAARLDPVQALRYD
jgi:ABC-type antimicrobial peptide transport system permease subunit